jgi:hypothetical protein
MVVLGLFLDVHNPQTPFIEGIMSIDWLGSVTVACATVMLLLGLQLGGVIFPWSSATVILLLVFGVLTFVLFLATQFKLSPSPIMPFRLFSSISKLSILAVVGLDAMVFNSVAYFLPLYFQIALDLSPLRAGMWMLAFAIPLAVVSGSSGWVMEKTGKYMELLRGGLLLMTIGIGLCISFPDYVSWPRIVFFLMIIGLGFGPNFQGPMTALQAHLEAKDQGAGMTTLSFLRMLSGAIGLVVGQVIFQRQMQLHLPSLADAGIPSDLLEGLARGSAISSTKEVLASLPENLVDLIRQAKTDSFSKVWIFYTAVSFVGLLASFGIQKKKLSNEHEEVKTGLPNASQGTATSSETVSLNV